jgi:hypothetical protein
MILRTSKRTADFGSPCYLRRERRAKIAVAVVACLAVGASYPVLCAQEGASTSRSVWDGVYTKEQADRGRTLYSQGCSKCHAESLGGNDEVPSLTGDQFFSDWDGLTVGDLFDRINKTMPMDNPGGVKREANADILAYILSVNSFPAGTTTLAARTEILAQIRIESTKPDSPRDK